MNLKSAILILFVLISGCARVDIKNREWCADKGTLGATCFQTLADGWRELPAQEWEPLRFGMVCGTPQAFGEFKTAILKLCNICNCCDYETKEHINKFFDRVKQSLPKEAQ